MLSFSLCKNFAPSWCLVLLIFGSIVSGEAAAFDNELLGKVIAGYQGWFSPKGNGANLDWFHWAPGHGPMAPGHCTFDLWPDLAEFTEEEKFATEFRFADGSIASVFSSSNPATVHRHFRWMKDYGIDGAALQRFGADLRSPQVRAWRDEVLAHCRTAAAEHGRIWFIMYDLSGLNDQEAFTLVSEDWRRLIGENDFRRDPQYTRHGGKPLVGLWGVGFNDHRSYFLPTCQRLLEFFKNDPHCGGNAVLLGVPYFWREGGADSLPSAELHPILEKADVISPWAVGRYSTLQAAREIGPKILQQDLVWCSQHHLAYIPVVFPGFSWQNMHRARGQDAPLDQIPRQGGSFLWSQTMSAIQAGSRAIYVAMFDELDEGTAILKVTNTPPVGESKFVTYEGLASDHYLWLVGQIRKVLEHPATATPEPPKR